MEVRGGHGLHKFAMHGWPSGSGGSSCCQEGLQLGEDLKHREFPTHINRVEIWIVQLLLPEMLNPKKILGRWREATLHYESGS